MSTPSSIELIRMVDRLRERLPEWTARYGLDSVAVFGSFVRGQASESSDLDLLIRWKAAPDRPEQLRAELSQTAGRTVHLVCAERLGPHLSAYVHREAIDLREPIEAALRARAETPRLVDVRDLLAEMLRILDRLAAELTGTPEEWERLNRWPALLQALGRWAALVRAIPPERWKDYPPVPHRVLAALEAISHGTPTRPDVGALYRLLAESVPQWRQALPQMIQIETKRIEAEQGSL